MMNIAIYSLIQELKQHAWSVICSLWVHSLAVSLEGPRFSMALESIAGGSQKCELDTSLPDSGLLLSGCFSMPIWCGEN